MSDKLTDSIFAASKYKIVQEAVSADKYSNIVHIDRIYKVPFLKKRDDVIKDFYNLEKTVSCCDGSLVYLSPDGWGDADCRTFVLHMTVIPNGGKIIYTDEMEDE